LNSKERHEARYQRRKAKREAARKARNKALGTMEQVFSFRDMMRYGQKCCNGVRWKQSTQNFEWHLFSGTAQRRRLILDGKWKPGKTNHFMLCERGKVRPIDAPHIKDRQVEKVLTKKILVPLYTPEMIYDNGASQKDKGPHWHYQRLKDQLRWHYRRYGREGAVFLLDFHNFFPAAPHDAIYKHHEKLIFDRRMRELADLIVRHVPGDFGMPLGVEPSQQEMVALPSPLDNFIKCQLGVHGAGHYMDDYYAIFPTVGAAKEAAEIIIAKAESLGFSVNRHKCHVIPLHKPFRFCKVKFQLTETGAVKTHGCRDGMKRARRKMKLFRGKVEAGTMTTQQVWQWLQSQLSYYKNFNDHGRVLRLMRLYHAMFVRDAVCATS